MHAASAEPWWKIAARYHLQAIYPRAPEIWHSLPNSTDIERERHEDIRSRPLFANHIRANTLISLHTNAFDSTATGTRVIYHTGRTADQLLANNILCYMKELIHAKDAYEEYVVPDQAEARNNLGENELATMPSVVVEIGFHDNVNDAVALQDPAFRTAAMKGLEKGYRLNSQGKNTCEPFQIERIPNVGGARFTTFPISIFYKGYPQFPIIAKLAPIECPPGTGCAASEHAYTEVTKSPLVYNFSCGYFDWTSTSRWKITLKDGDDVEPEPVEFNVTCTVGSTATTGGPLKDSAAANFTQENAL